MDDYHKEEVDSLIKSINSSLGKLEEAYLELDAIKYDLNILIGLLKDKFGL